MRILLCSALLLALVATCHSWSFRRIISHVLGSNARHSHDEETNEVTTIENWRNPRFCNGLDCPKYEVIEKTAEYELRRYAKAGWVSTNMVDMSYMRSSGLMFRKLFKYIQGENAAGAKIPMTAPVTMRIIPGQGPACEQNFTMSFFVSGDFAAAPKPTKEDVFLNEAPQIEVYVRQFDGYAMTFSKWREQALALAEAINDPTLYHEDFYYTAGYNSPFQILHRHNEVWFIKK